MMEEGKVEKMVKYQWSNKEVWLRENEVQFFKCLPRYAKRHMARTQRKLIRTGKLIETDEGLLYADQIGKDNI